MHRDAAAGGRGPSVEEACPPGTLRGGRRPGGAGAAGIIPLSLKTVATTGAGLTLEIALAGAGIVLGIAAMALINVYRSPAITDGPVFMAVAMLLVRTIGLAVGTLRVGGPVAGAAGTGRTSPVADSAA